MEKETYLNKSRLLDFDHPALASLIDSRGWKSLPAAQRIKQIYNFVRDEIPFGYNQADDLRASEVLADGMGQCNTKATLLLALLRACGIPGRMHGFTIDRALQEGVIYGIWYKLAPDEILHAWVEVQHEGKWTALEGVILDLPLLHRIQHDNPDADAFCGFGACTESLQNPAVEFDGRGTFIQARGIKRDFGVYDSPDQLFAEHSQKLSLLRRLVFEYIGRHRLNANVKRLRSGQASAHQKNPVPRLRIGQPAPEFSGHSPWHEALVLRPSSRPVVLIFLRYQGCPICQMEISRLVSETSRLTGNIPEIFVFLQSTPDSIAEEAARDSFPFTVIADPQGEIYDQYGVTSGAGYLHPRNLYSLFLAHRKGFRHGRFEGREFQMPAAFALDDKGMIRMAHYGSHLSDLPALAELAAAATAGLGQDLDEVGRGIAKAS